MNNQKENRRFVIRMIALVLLLCSVKIHAQFVIEGDTIVHYGDRVTYTLKDLSSPGGVVGSQYYEISWYGDAIVIGNDNNIETTVDVCWNIFDGEDIWFGVSFMDMNTYEVYYVDYPVDVLPNPAVPPTPVILSSTCNEVVIQRANPPDIVYGTYHSPEIKYYWQTTPDGTSTSNSASTLTLTTNGQYFLRARSTETNNNSAHWSASSSSIQFNVGSAAPVVGSITQPTATTATGSVELSGLPIIGSWTLNPGSISGTGTTTTVTGLTSGTTYNFTVTNSSGCVSNPSANVVINSTGSNVETPILSSVIQPSCTTDFGSFTITNYNASYTYLSNPSTGVIISGNTVTAPEGTYTFTAISGSSTSSTSASVTVNASPVPSAPIVSTIYQTTSYYNAMVTLTGLPEGNWIINPGNVSGTGSATTVQNLTSNTIYNFTVTNAAGCISPPSTNVSILNGAIDCVGSYTTTIDPDPNSHWVNEISYDTNNSQIGFSRTYFNDLGQQYLSLSKDMTVSGYVWGSETLYDSFNRPYKTSFPELSPNCNLDKIQIFGSNRSSYYNDNNTKELYQATAEQPFWQTNYDILNPGNVINVVGGNKINNEWKTAYSYTVPAAQEMYYVYGSDYYEGAMSSQGEEVITKFIKSVSVDANGVENVVFSDGEGKVLATARSGGATSYPVVSLIGTQGFVDVHIPAVLPGNTAGAINLLINPSLYKIYDLKTGLIVSSTALSPGSAYRIEALAAPVTDPKVYINAGVPVPETGALGISYSVNYYDYAVNVYNKTGQLVKSIQPKGYDNIHNIVPVKGTPTPISSGKFTTVYSYDNQGQIKEVVSPDEGISKFAYRKDGQVRYSQNAAQAPSSKISYVNYDGYGRPIESGVVSGVQWSDALNGVDTSAVIGSQLNVSERTFSVYDDTQNTVTSPQIPTSYSFTIPSHLTLATFAPSYIQNNLSGNVAVTYKVDSGSINSITWYSYDIYGRTEWIVQYNEGLGAKTVHYEYDYVGNVAKVLFQKDNTSELFVHRYTYNRNKDLIKVETSADDVNFINQADYSYYLTGELKRVNIAQGLQGLDYVYTLGGQLKSINHPSLESAKDPGLDSNDVFGLALDYYDGDYLRTGRNITTSPNTENNYNGNIKSVRWANKGNIQDYSGGVVNQKGYKYKYNRNNWLTEAKFGTSDSGTAYITESPDGRYKESGLDYDANGNIKTLQRTNGSGSLQDNLTYAYNNNQNQLNRVTDASGSSSNIHDIGTQAVDNYGYDNIGQMTRNNQEDIDYAYNTQGLVTQISKTGHLLLKFFYNERGQRIKKESYSTSGNYSLTNSEYYVYDLSGNVIAIYNQQASSSTIVLKDLTIFGLNRLGVYNKASAISSYEITDHLGNVRAVIKNVNGKPQIQSFADYYPFGEQLIGRSVTNNYRYAFQGQELDSETNMEAFQLRLWDGRLGRWLSTDPAGQFASPYLGMGNNPVNGIDSNGGVYMPYFGPSMDEAKHFGIGVWKHIKALGSAIYHFDDTITGLANLTELGVASSGILGGSPFYSAETNALIYDAQYTKTNTVGSLNNFNAGLDKFYANITSRNLNVRAEAFGGLFSSFFGAKGIGALGKASVSYVPIVAEAGVSGEVLALRASESQLLLGSSTIPTGNFYSVAFEMSLKSTSYPGVSAYKHFQEANIALDAAMQYNTSFRNLGITIPRSSSGSIMGKSPVNWVWHHDIGIGIMQLVPKSQHPSIPGGIFWQSMHPEGKGGMSIWGGGY